MRKARIYQRGMRATQSGKARADSWILEPEPVEKKRPDPMMGWVGSGDTETQLQLTFPSLESALAYAAREGFEPQVEQPPARKLILQSYAENFR
jgi:hypothetical protein